MSSASESFFSGTHEIEKELIQVCAQDILRGEGKFDGYVASGGTESNMQACWIYRNYFMEEHGAKPQEIGILCSADTHYSMAKSANVLGISNFAAAVDDTTRLVSESSMQKAIDEARSAGVKYIIAVPTMMTTMFGSVDPIAIFTDALDRSQLPYRVHVDGAYGGFFYPFSQKDNQLDFSNPKVNSITLDAHKMVQAPYGTGIFLIREGFMRYANTKEASYVEGEDSTLIGSRSGANAIAIWMILMTYGPYGWKEKIFILLKRTEWFCEQLREKNIAFYRNPDSNIVTIRAQHVPQELAEKYVLVPDNHHQPNWYKVVVMEHVTIERLLPVVEGIN